MGQNLARYRYILAEERPNEWPGRVAAFSEACAHYASQLHLSPAELAEIQALALGLRQAVDRHYEAQALASALVTERDQTIAAARSRLSELSRRFHADPDVTEGVLAALELAPKRPRRTVASLQAPHEMNIRVTEQGIAKLSWHRSGNSRGVVFLIESRIGDGEWTQIEACTATRVDIPVTVGVPIQFRVTASRRGERSAPSVPLVLWSSSSASFADAA